jgi:hypothetical protein
MFKRWAALALVLALAALTPDSASAQAQQQDTRRTGGFGQNWPNPFNPETTIPFSIGDEACQGSSKEHVVTIQIINPLGQVIASPRMQGPTAGAGTTGAAGQLVRNLKLQCGEYTAFWNGKFEGTDREVPSTMYVARLFVDGRVVGVLRMLVQK